MKKMFVKMMAMLLTILLSIVPVYADTESSVTTSDESTAIPLTDSGEFSAEKELAILRYFNIIDKEASPDKELTKLDYILMLCKMLLKDAPLTSEAKGLFYDYEASEPYAAEVEYAYESGIITGDSEGFLRGNAKLKTTDAIVMTIRALGYDSIAQENGGYPVGYLIAAGKLKLTQGLKDSYNDVITLREASKLVFNAMNVPTLIFCAEDKDYTYMAETEQTILSSLYDVSLVKGTINANRYVSLPAGKGVAEDKVSISNMLFEEGETNATNLLGYYVEGYFVSDDDGNRTLIYADVSENDVVRFNARDCNYYKPGEISYYNEVTNKEVKYEISPLASTLVNFAPYKMAGALVPPVAGEFELIDNDRDGVFDVVRVDSYEVFVMSGKNINDDILYNKNNSVDYLDLNDYKVPVIKNVDGTKLELGDLQDGDIFFVQRNKDVKYLNMIHLNKSVNVTIGEITEQDDYTTVTDKETGTSYRVSPWYDAIKSNTKIKLGETYFFIFDIFGDICAIKTDSNSSTLSYGYLVNFTRNIKEIDKTVKFKIFDAEGEFLMLTAAKRVKTNLYGNIKPEDLIQKGISDGIIMFSVNQEGKLDALDFPVADAKDGFRQIGDTGEKATSQYKNQSGTIGGKILLNNDTVIFVVPEDKSEEENFYIYKLGNMVHNNYYTNSKGYSSTTNSFASEAVVIPQESTTMLATNASIFVVQEVGDYYNGETGDSGKEIRGYADGVYKEMPVSSSLSLEYTCSGKKHTLGEGDVIKYASDKNGKIMSYSMLFSNAARAVMSENNNNVFTTTERDDYGVIMQRKDNCFKFMHSGSSQMSNDCYVIQKTTVVYELDTSNKRDAKLRVIDYNQIETREDNSLSNATAFVRLYGSAPVVVVIYK